MSHVMPTVTEKRDGSIFSFNLPSRLLEDSCVYLNGAIDDDVAYNICMQLRYLDAKKKEGEADTSPIKLYINSPGGVITAGMAIYDTIRDLDRPVHTYCFGQAASMGAFLLSIGEKRYCAEHARVMIHQPLGGSQGQSTDIDISNEEIQRMRQELSQIMAKHCNQDPEDMLELMERDTFMSGKRAKDFGLVDGTQTPKRVPAPNTTEPKLKASELIDEFRKKRRHVAKLDVS